MDKMNTNTTNSKGKHDKSQQKTEHPQQQNDKTSPVKDGIVKDIESSL